MTTDDPIALTFAVEALEALEALDNESGDLWRIVRQAILADPTVAVAALRKSTTEALFATACLADLLVAEWSTLGVTLRQALHDDPAVTAAEVRAILAAALIPPRK